MKMIFLQIIFQVFLISCVTREILGSDSCLKTHTKDCIRDKKSSTYKYTKEANYKWEQYKEDIAFALANYTTCYPDKCMCHSALIKSDLALFAEGITFKDIEESRSRGTLYQIINHQLFRDKECMFPSRCSGIQHFLLKIINKLPNMEFVINTRDWPQVPKHYGIKKTIFSFSKTKDFMDIIYPAWTFWEGGPAISIYPTGVGRWDMLRESLMREAEQWPWDKKKDVAFFRGSRTSAERDPLIYLSRSSSELVDAQYTKNQAWKSDADTLFAPPATEVSLEEHCSYKYLFNYRGVAASFRFKHLFLCGSLVFHVGEEWIEFFYPQLKPWVHYIPVPSTSSEEDLKDLILFVKKNDELGKQIADRGFKFIRDHLRMKDVRCYWKTLLTSYHKLIRYEIRPRSNLIKI